MADAQELRVAGTKHRRTGLRSHPESLFVVERQRVDFVSRELASAGKTKRLLLFPIIHEEALAFRSDPHVLLTVPAETQHSQFPACAHPGEGDTGEPPVLSATIHTVVRPHPQAIPAVDSERMDRIVAEVAVLRTAGVEARPLTSPRIEAVQPLAGTHPEHTVPVLTEAADRVIGYRR